jgi:hypothetical protein
VSSGLLSRGAYATAELRERNLAVNNLAAIGLSRSFHDLLSQHRDGRFALGLSVLDVSQRVADDFAGRLVSTRVH